jgi:hypothetical protein
MKTLKYLLMAAFAAAALTACHSPRNQGRPGDESTVNADGTKKAAIPYDASRNFLDGWNH